MGLSGMCVWLCSMSENLEETLCDDERLVVGWGSFIHALLSSCNTEEVALNFSPLMMCALLLAKLLKPEK